MKPGIWSHIAWVVSGAAVAVPFLLALEGDIRQLAALALPAFLILGDVLIWATRRRLDLGALRWLQFFSGWLVTGALMLALLA